MTVAPLRPDAIHVWAVRTDAEEFPPELLDSILAPDEKARAARFVVDPPRRTYQTSRVALRLLLGCYTDAAPSAIEFAYSERGKPSLKGGEDIRFNVSHSDGLVLIAFARGVDVGVDVEKIRPVRELENIARSYFCPEERQELLALSGEEQQRAFFTCWTRKEAYIKATGDGLHVPLDSFCVSVLPDEIARFRYIGSDAAEASHWLLQELATQPGYAAALACRSSACVRVLLPTVHPAELLA